MGSLVTCLRKAGKAISADDAEAIRDIYNDYVAGGMPAAEAGDRAISDYIDILVQEKTGIVEQARNAGANVSGLLGKLRYAADSKDMDIARKLSIADMLYGDTPLPGITKKSNVSDLAKVLTKRARKLNRGKALNAKTARNKDIISEVIANEVVEAMKQSGHAGHWYSGTLREAMAIAGELHPEINTDTTARNAFLVAMAITSNGATVGDNADHAELVYSQYKRNKGRFPITGFGDTADSMKKGFKLYNDLREKWGANILNEFLHTTFTVGELQLLGLKVSGENVDTVVYGSAVFGPKVGQAFFQNISGNFTPLTMDRWWMRTWGRIVGNLAPEGISAAGAQQEKLLALLDANQAKVESMGYTVRELEMSDKKLLEFARKIHREYANGKFKDKSDLNKAAKNFDNAVNMPVISPRNGDERNWIREVVYEAQNKLKQRGVDADIASMQALLWYPEKEFYIKLGVSNERAKATDYSIEFARLAAGRGINQQRINAAIDSARAGQPSGPVGAPAGSPVEKGHTGALTAEARRQLVQAGAVRAVRERSGTAFSARVPGRDQRVLGGAEVHKIHTPAKTTVTRYARAGIATPSFAELAQGPASAELFFEKLEESGRKVPKGLAGQVKESYEDARLFITEDGMAGFALEGDRITSLFKHPKADMPAMTHSALRLAAEQGGRQMTIPEDGLVGLAGMQGFKPVARISTKDGTVVGMVYDQNSFDPYTGPVESVDTFDQMSEIMTAGRDVLHPRNSPRKPLMYRLEDEADGRTTPLSELSKLAATVDDQMNYGPGDAGTFKSWIGDLTVGKNASNLERVLAFIPRRNIQDFVDQVAMPSAKKYIRVANRMDGRRNELLELNGKVAQRWNKFTSANKDEGRILGELMHASTLAGVDPSKAYAPLKARERMSDADKIIDAKRRGDWQLLSRWWERLSPEAREIYTSVRDSYAEMRSKIEAALEARILQTAADKQTKLKLMTELRKKFEAGRVAGPYFPLARFGELWGVAKDARGNVVSFSRFEKVSEQREWMKGFREEGYTVDGGKKMEDAAILNRIDPEFVSKITGMAKQLDVGLADEIWQMYLRAMPEMSMRKAFIHRKGRLGFSADAVRAFGHNMFHGAHQLSKLEHMHMMEAHLDSMKKEARAMEQEGHKDALWAAAAVKEMNKRHEWAKAPKASLFATKATAFGFAWYLGATPAAALVNLSQTAIVGYPVLGSAFNYLGAFRELSAAIGQWAASRGSMGDKLRGDERAAWDEFHRIGLFDKTLAHDLAGVSEEGVDYSDNWRRATQVVSWMFHKAEEANRQVTAMAAYRLGRKAGMSHEDALLKAEDLTWDSHFDYNNVNRPRLLQSDAAKVLLLFRQYSLNMTYRLARDFNDSIRGGSKENRVEARKRLGGILMMTSLFAGASGLPAMWLVEMVANAMLGDEDEPFDAKDSLRVYLTDMYGEDVATAIIKGPMDLLTGATLSSRVSLNNLWLREAPEYLEGTDLYLHYIGELVGPIPAIAGEFFKAGKNLSEGHVDRAMEQLVPKAVKDNLKAIRYASEGVQNMRGDVILSKEEMSKLDLVRQSIGFVPEVLSTRYEENRALSNAARALQERRQRLMDKLFLTYRQGDKPQEVLAEIRRFNAKNPAISIDAGNIISSAKSRATYSQRAVHGVTLPKNLEYLRNKIRFSDKEGGE